MDRRAFLATASAAAIAPIMPATAQPTIGIDFAPLPDELEDRGYDMTTLKFSISQKEPK